MPRNQRILAITASASLLASLAVAAAAPVAAGPGCTYDMAKEMVGYDPTGATVNLFTEGIKPAPPTPDDVGPGMVVCGGPGTDRVGTISKGGTFYGRGGSDEAEDVLGTFYGGPGSDGAYFVSAGGKFNGGRGADSVYEYIFGGGKFIGSRGNDDAKWVLGKFLGAGGVDEAEIVYSTGVFIGGPGRDALDVLYGAFYGNKGPDRAGLTYTGAYYNGGPGTDSVGQLDCAATIKSVEDVETAVC